MKKSRKLYEYFKYVRCPVCDRKNFRYVTKTDLYRCIICGAMFDVDYQKKEVKLIHEKGV